MKKRSFSVKWLDEPLFEGWLMECDGKPKCKCCNVSLSAKKSDLIKHANTNKHKISSQKIANTKTLNVLFKQQNITKDIMIADLKYTLLVVSHNFSFNSVQHIVNISKSVFKWKSKIKSHKM